jgi:hypothetical protein
VTETANPDPDERVCFNCVWLTWAVAIGHGLLCRHPANKPPDEPYFRIPSRRFSCPHFERRPPEPDPNSSRSDDDDCASPLTNSDRLAAAHVIPTVSSESDLLAHLRFFAPPVFRSVPDTPLARRWLIERIRPALRFFCGRFDVPIPKWLSLDADARFRRLPTRERIAKLGTAPVVIIEHEPWRPPRRR